MDTTLLARELSAKLFRPFTTMMRDNSLSAYTVNELRILVNEGTLERVEVRQVQPECVSPILTSVQRLLTRLPQHCRHRNDFR